MHSVHAQTCEIVEKEGTNHPAFLTLFFANFLIHRCSYMLHNKTQSSGESGWISCRDGMQNSSFSLMNRPQTSARQTENTIEHLLTLYLMKPGLPTSLNVSPYVLHIRLMVS